MDIVRTEINITGVKIGGGTIAILIKRLEVAQYFLTAITSHSMYQSFIHSCNFKDVRDWEKLSQLILFSITFILNTTIYNANTNAGLINIGLILFTFA